ncbi:MAG: hypothetical protein U1G08_03040 [Verrucomicrobiota bacterium]
MYHGPAQRMLLENHLWATLSLHGIGVLTIVDPKEIPLPGALGHGAPALQLSNEEWQDVAVDLIKKAEIIVSEVPALTPGARFELDTCVAQGKAGVTVVVIPSPDGPISPLLDDDPTIAHLPRVISYDELPEVGAFNHFVFRDLVDRARGIARLAPDERRRMVENGEAIQRFPLTFEGLREGYEQMADFYKGAGNFPRAARAYFRALVVAKLKGELAATGLPVQDDTARLAVISEEIAGMAISMNDQSTARNYLRGGIRLADAAGDTPRRERLEERLRQLELEG